MNTAPPPEFRLCPFCDDTPETEIHFLLYCNKYNMLRQEYFSSKDLYGTCPNFYYKTDANKITIKITDQRTSIPNTSYFHRLFLSLKAPVMLSFYWACFPASLIVNIPSFILVYTELYG